MENKKYKVIIPEHITKQINELPEKEQKEIMEAIKEISESPFNFESREITEIEPLPEENCLCGLPYRLLEDVHGEEVYFSCRADKCEGFWMTKQELKEGRKNLEKQTRTTIKEV